MKKIKILFLFLLIFLFSGCNVNYTLNINDDLSVNENTNISKNEEYFVMYLEFGYSKYDAYESYIENEKEQLKNNAYSYSYDGNNGANISKDGESLEEYLASSLLSENIFDDIMFDEEDNIITIETSSSKITSYITEFEKVDSAIINIILPFEVLESNADIIDEDKYTWNMDENDNKKVYIKFNSNNVTYGVDSKDVKNILIISVVIVLLIISAIIILVIRNKKNNKI